MPVYVNWIKLAGSWGEFEPTLPLLWDTELSPLWTLCPSFSQPDTAGIIPLFPHESSSDQPLSANKAFGYAVWWPKLRGGRDKTWGWIWLSKLQIFFTCPPPGSCWRLLLSELIGWKHSPGSQLWKGKWAAESDWLCRGSPENDKELKQGWRN